MIKLFFICLFFVVAVPGALAEDGHSAQELSRSHGNLILKPNQAITFELKFKNTGTTTWVNYGENFMELVTAEPVLRKSVFEHSYWEKYYLVARVEEKEVAPGEVGTFRFALQAPVDEGFYLEKFKLVARRRAWVDQGDVSIPIYVYEENPFGVNTTVDADVTSETEDDLIQTIPEKEISVPASAKGLAAQLLITSGTIQAYSGERKEITLGFKNIGSKVWKNSGEGFISMYTMDPKYHASDWYVPGTWYSDSQVVLSTQEVQPGEIGYFKFLIQASEKIGSYTESFRLASEDYAWVYNGDVTLNMTVSQKPEITSVVNETSGVVIETADLTSEQPAVEIAMTDESYASYLLLNPKTVSVAPNETFVYKLGFKNIGTKTWQKSGRSYVSLYTAKPKYHDSLLKPDNTSQTTWASDHQVLMDSASVDPGVLGFFSITMQAPEKEGVYTEHFRLAAEDTAWIGDVISLTVQVSKSGAVYLAGSTGSVAFNISEPLLRVGLFRPDEPLEITANGNFFLADGDNNIIEEFIPGETVNLEYVPFEGKYRARFHGQDNAYDHYLRLLPSNRNAIFEITNYEKRPNWNTSYNDNRFRGVLELRYNDSKDRTWIINEIGMEDYLKGLIETSNYNPMEYLKTMTIAARTYGLYHFNKNDKHDDEFFHMDAYYDQVYRGYSAEARMPRLVTAVEETRGEIVTYNGEVVVTPYYAHSDGRTRSWEEVWGGEPKPWLKSVPDPYNVGRTMFGHGVGLSARGALYMAKDDGLDYTTILKYYYQDIEVEKLYK